MLPGVIGLLQATEAIKILLGKGDLLVGRLLHFDAFKMQFQEFRVRRRASCIACGEGARTEALMGAGADPAGEGTAGCAPTTCGS